MELWKSVLSLVLGVLRRFWYWVPPLLLDPFEVYNKFIQPNAPNAWGWMKVDLPSGWALFALVVLIFWAAILTHHETRKSLPASIMPDWPMRDALEFVLGGRLLGANTDFGRVGPILDQFRERARLGDVTIWGRPNFTDGAALKPPLEEIDPIYWRVSQIDFMKISFRNLAETERADHVQVWESYGDLYMSKAQVKRVWRPKRRWPRLRLSIVRGNDGAR